MQEACFGSALLQLTWPSLNHDTPAMIKWVKKKGNPWPVLLDIDQNISKGPDCASRLGILRSSSGGRGVAKADVHQTIGQSYGPLDNERSLEPVAMARLNRVPSNPAKKQVGSLHVGSKIIPGPRLISAGLIRCFQVSSASINAGLALPFTALVVDINCTMMQYHLWTCGLFLSLKIRCLVPSKIWVCKLASPAYSCTSSTARACEMPITKH